MSASNYYAFDQGKDAIEAKIKEFGGLVVVDFHSPDCIDCKRLAAGLPGLAQKNPDVLFLTVDINNVPNARDIFGIPHIPDVRFYKGSMDSLANSVMELAPQIQAKIDQLK